MIVKVKDLVYPQTNLCGKEGLIVRNYIIDHVNTRTDKLTLSFDEVSIVLTSFVTEAFDIIYHMLFENVSMRSVLELRDLNTKSRETIKCYIDNNLTPHKNYVHDINNLLNNRINNE